MASPTSLDFHWPSFSGTYSRLVGVRAEGWAKHFEECMMVAAKAQEDLANVEASIGDLVPIAEEKKEKGSTKKA